MDFAVLCLVLSKHCVLVTVVVDDYVRDHTYIITADSPRRLKVPRRTMSVPCPAVGTVRAHSRYSINRCRTILSNQIMLQMEKQ